MIYRLFELRKYLISVTSYLADWFWNTTLGRIVAKQYNCFSNGTESMKCSKTKIRGGLNEQIFVTTNNPTGSASKYKDTIGGYGLPFKSSSEIERCENMRRPATYFVTYFMSFHILRPPFNSYCVTDRLANMALKQGATKVCYRKNLELSLKILRISVDI